MKRLAVSLVMLASLLGIQSYAGGSHNATHGRAMMMGRPAPTIEKFLSNTYGDHFRSELRTIDGEPEAKGPKPSLAPAHAPERLKTLGQLRRQEAIDRARESLRPRPGHQKAWADSEEASDD